MCINQYMYVVTKQIGLLMKAKITFSSFSSYPQCYTPEENLVVPAFCFDDCLPDFRCHNCIYLLIYPTLDNIKWILYIWELKIQSTYSSLPFSISVIIYSFSIIFISLNNIFKLLFLIPSFLQYLFQLHEWLNVM